MPTTVNKNNLKHVFCDGTQVYKIIEVDEDGTEHLVWSDGRQPGLYNDEGQLVDDLKSLVSDCSNIKEILDKNPLGTILILPETITSLASGSTKTEFIDGKYEQVIYSKCFGNVHSLKKIILPDSLQEIGLYAFYNFYYIEEIEKRAAATETDRTTLPNTYVEIQFGSGLKEIYKASFYNCNFKDMIFPTSVRYFNYDSWERSSSLFNVYILGTLSLPYEDGTGRYPADIDRKKTIPQFSCEGVLFNNLIIPEGTERINQQAIVFSKIMPKNYTYVKDMDFIIPSSVNFIGEGAFLGVGFKSIKFECADPNTVIYPSAFTAFSRPFDNIKTATGQNDLIGGIKDLYISKYMKNLFEYFEDWDGSRKHITFSSPPPKDNTSVNYTTLNVENIYFSNEIECIPERTFGCILMPPEKNTYILKHFYFFQDGEHTEPQLKTIGEMAFFGGVRMSPFLMNELPKSITTMGAVFGQNLDPDRLATECVPFDPSYKEPAILDISHLTSLQSLDRDAFLYSAYRKVILPPQIEEMPRSRLGGVGTHQDFFYDSIEPGEGYWPSIEGLENISIFYKGRNEYFLWDCGLPSNYSSKTAIPLEERGAVFFNNNDIVKENFFNQMFIFKEIHLVNYPTINPLGYICYAELFIEGKDTTVINAKERTTVEITQFGKTYSLTDNFEKGTTIGREYCPGQFKYTKISIPDTVEQINNWPFGADILYYDGDLVPIKWTMGNDPYTAWGASAWMNKGVLHTYDYKIYHYNLKSSTGYCEEELFEESDLSLLKDIIKDTSKIIVETDIYTRVPFNNYRGNLYSIGTIRDIQYEIKENIYEVNEGVANSYVYIKNPTAFTAIAPNAFKGRDVLYYPIEEGAPGSLEWPSENPYWGAKSIVRGRPDDMVAS